MPLIKFSVETLTCVREDSDLTAGAEPYLWIAAIAIDSKRELRDGRAMEAVYPRAAVSDKSPLRLGKEVVAVEEVAIPAEQGQFEFNAKSPSQSRYRFILIVLLWDEDNAVQDLADAGYSGFKQAMGKIVDSGQIASLLNEASLGNTESRDTVRDEISVLLKVGIDRSIRAKLGVSSPPIDMDDIIGSASATLGNRNGVFMLDIAGNDTPAPDLSQNRWLVRGKYSNPELVSPPEICSDDRRSVALAKQRLSSSESKLAQLQMSLNNARPQEKPRFERQITAQEEVIANAHRTLVRTQSQLQQCVELQQNASVLENEMSHRIFISF